MKKEEIELIGKFKILSLTPITILDLEKDMKIFIGKNEVFSEANPEVNDVIFGTIYSKVVEGKTTSWHFKKIKEVIKNQD